MKIREKLHAIISSEPVASEPRNAVEEQAVVSIAFAAAALHVIDTVMKAKNISRRMLADKLGVSESTISRQLDERANLETKTLGRIFWAIEDVPQFTSREYCRLVAQGVAQDLKEFVPTFSQANIATSRSQVVAIVSLPPQARASNAPQVTEIEA